MQRDFSFTLEYLFYKFFGIYILTTTLLDVF